MGKRIYTHRKTASTLRVRRRMRELKQYRHLMHEVSEGRERLGELELQKKECAGAEDDVTAVRIAGMIAAYRTKIRRNTERCYEAAVAIQSYINLIEDSVLRRIFTLYYLKGYSWQRVARELGYSDESVARKRHNRYIAFTERQNGEEKED